VTVLRALLPVLVALVLAGCSAGDSDEAATPSEPPTADRPGSVVELENVLGLASDFRADEGKTRVILLFSPT